MNKLTFIVCCLRLTQGAVISENIERLQSLIKLPTEKNETEKCTAGYLGGLCTYAWECKHGGGYPNGVCNRGFQYGVCCTTRTTIRVHEPKLPTLNNASPDYDCGTTMVETAGRIINGTEAIYGTVPWVASVSLVIAEYSDAAIHFCGASLVNRQWVVTSAHCIFMYDNELEGLTIKLRFGEHDMDTEAEEYPHVDRTVTKQIIHPDFRIVDFYSDIALMKLNEPIEYQPNIRPICLPGNQKLLDGQLGVVSGWGRVEEGGNTSPVLQKVPLPIMKNKDCEKIFLEGRLRENISSVYMCAGFQDGRQDACTGDSGGPMQLRSQDGKYFLAGIVSWGYGCSRPNKPGVYTRVAEFVPWILENIS